MIKSSLLIITALAGTLALAGCSTASETPADTGSAPAQTASDDQESGPVTADMLVDGTYEISVDSSSSMFRIVHAELTVADGQMTCAMTLGGTGYEKLFMGTSDEAASASDDQCHFFVEGDDGSYTYTVPVASLDEECDCAAFSIRKQKWYDRSLVFESGDLPESAFRSA
ncbi:hypothetical protein B5F74_04605 [Collinsella sp. An271]|uniref:hypothetical protein n=1 Tax=Collinsella sp. An271 TaxID=1965616 RepID=UPI000B3A9821|nr:hypothetical protein [Collinsella sp. An271]OUO61413.1 hypothetical protein B5F74_04605 [Collinsella sp. An271]